MPDAGIKFLASGHSVLSGSAFEATLSDFINAVIARLDDMGLPGITLHEEWMAIQRADADEQEFCHAAARLGADPYAVDNQLEAEILNVSIRIRPELLNDFLSLATVDRLASQASALAAASQDIASDADYIDALTGVRNEAPPFTTGANSFAAEFLAPHRMLKSDLSGAIIGEDEINDLAIEYGVSAFVIRHRIENHRLAHISL